MPITKLHLTNVGPFDEIEFEFDHQVNVFTGPNNSGKSSALWALADTSVYPFHLPRKLLREDSTSEFSIHTWGGDEDGFSGQLPIQVVERKEEEQEAGYWTLERTREHVRVLEMIGYSKFIPALRRSTDFRSPGPTVTQREGHETHRRSHPGDQDADPVTSLRRSRLLRPAIPVLNPELKKRLALVSENPSLVSDEAVIQQIVDLDYRSYLRKEPKVRDIIVKVGEMASQIMDGFQIQFNGVSEDEGGFFPQFDTVDGAMPLNTLSQGTQSIVQWLAHLLIGYAEFYDFPEELEKKPGVLIVDEIDAHLHPSWQRRVIPTLTSHLPGLQIFCSTHSPLMLAGLKEGQIQLLRRDDQGNVTVSRNEADVFGWSADEILRGFLEVTDPTDLREARNLEKLRTLREKDRLSVEEAEELETLRSTVGDALLSGPVSAHLDEFTKVMERAKAEAADSFTPPSSDTDQ